MLNKILLATPNSKPNTLKKKFNVYVPKLESHPVATHQCDMIVTYLLFDSYFSDST